MIELRLFGSLQLDGLVEGEPSLASQPKRLALLSYLAMMGDRGAPRRDKILALLWPELDETRGRNALSQSLHVIRRSLGANSLITEGDDAVRLATDVVWTDVAEFDRAIRDGDPGAAMALYRGDLLDGFFISRAPEFERWLETERESRRRRAVAASFSLAEEAGGAGDGAATIEWTTRAVDVSNFNESDVRRAMILLERIGEFVPALALYDRLRARLSADHEMAPSSDTVSIAVRVRGTIPAPAVTSGRVSESPLFPSPARPRLRLYYPILGAGVAGAALSAIAFIASARNTPHSIIKLPVDVSAAPPATAIAGTTLALSPDGSRLVYVAASPGGTQLVTRTIDRVEVTPIPNTTNARHPFFSPDGEWIAFEQNGWLRRVRFNGADTLTICAGDGVIRGASWAARDEIVYAAQRGLWRVAATGGIPTEVPTQDSIPGVARWPDLLPDGSAALFTMTTRTGSWLVAQPFPSGRLKQLGIEGSNVRFVPPDHIVFARGDGTLMSARFDPRRLIVLGAPTVITADLSIGNAGAGKFAASRSGSIVYLAEPRERTLVLVDALGGRVTLDSTRRPFGTARFSPDGRRIAVNVMEAGPSRGDIWVIDVQRHVHDRVTSDGGSINPVWSTDGGQIIHATMTPSAIPGFAVREVSLQGTIPGRTILDPDEGQIPQAVTPDGRLVFQRRDMLTGWNLWIVSLAGSARPESLVVGEHDQFAATVSPDGRWLAYVSNESGADQVYVRALRGSRKGIPISAGEGREPKWSRSGKELFYRGGGSMFAVSVGGEPLSRRGQPRRLFDDRDFSTAGFGVAYDVHPDGRFLMLEKPKSGAEMVVLLRWFEG